MTRILLVDDNESFRTPLRSVLERAGYEVQVADEGRSALNLYQEQPFDLVITDLIMPGKEGLETIMELRQFQPGPKVIAMSGGGRMDASDYLPMAKRLGATETLAKPFTADEILKLVRRVLSQTG